MSATTTTQMVSAAIPAISGLLGVLIGGVLQWWQADSIAKRQQREADRKTNQLAAAAEAELAKRRALAAYPVALHLEAFAKTCAERLSHNTDPREVTGWKPPSLSDLSKPDLTRLGPEWSVRLTDFASALLLRLDYIQGSAEDVEASDKREIYAEANAVIGLDAWDLAEALRRETGISPFEFHDDGWNYVETMKQRWD